MNAQLSIFDLPTLLGSPNAISSPEAASGASLPASQGGPTTGHSGPALARASRSASREKEEAPTIQGTCGPTSFASSVPAGPLKLWESKLAARLAMVGSTEFPLIWKEKVTPAGRSISRLAPSMRRTSDSGSIGWPTPLVNDTLGSQYCYGPKRPDGTRPIFLKLPGAAMAHSWATPKASDGEGGRTTKTEGGGNAHLPIQARESAPWSTPRASGNENRTTKITPSQAAGKHGMYLAVQAIGTTPNSGSAQTEKRGALSPEFVFWLQGFPTAWVVCALLSAKRGKGL